MKSLLNKKFSAVGVGSLPFENHQQAVSFIEKTFKDDIIFWPQLVKSSFLENMYVQFSQGLPAVKINQDKRNIYIDTQIKDYQNQLQLSLEHYLNNDLDYFAISQDYAAGFYEMLENGNLSEKEYFKGQVIGPISFGLSVQQEDGRSIIYNQELYQVLLKILSMKARWQIKKIKAKNPKLKVIIFIDEPYLVSMGSSFVSLKKEDVINDLNEIIDAIHQEGAFAGIHCCGNTDWPILLQTKMDILNFDAFNYRDNLLIFQEELNLFLKNGGILAWGIVPTSEKINDANIESNLLNVLKGISSEKKLFSSQSIITPSCGCGTLSLQLAKKVHLLTVRLAEKLNQDKIFS